MAWLNGRTPSGKAADDCAGRRKKQGNMHFQTFQRKMGRIRKREIKEKRYAPLVLLMDIGNDWRVPSAGIFSKGQLLLLSKMVAEPDVEVAAPAKNPMNNKKGKGPS